jgi:prophage DNA circulation protein
MDGNTELLKMIALFGALPGMVFYGLSKVIPMILRSRTDGAQANADTAEANARGGMLEWLQARLAKVEEAQISLNKQLDDERSLRRTAEDMVARLTRRVLTLEQFIRGWGGTPPPDDPMTGRLPDPMPPNNKTQ